MLRQKGGCMREILRMLYWEMQENCSRWHPAVTLALCTVSGLIDMDRSYGIYMKKQWLVCRFVLTCGCEVMWTRREETFGREGRSDDSVMCERKLWFVTYGNISLYRFSLSRRCPSELYSQIWLSRAVILKIQTPRVQMSQTTRVPSENNWPDTKITLFIYSFVALHNLALHNQTR